MTKHFVVRQVTVLLEELQLKLLDANLWSEYPPSEQAMSSDAPFACDTMSFENWLQFIFVPKMQLLIINNQRLPCNIALLPMAEQMWQRSPEVQRVLEIIGKLDEVLSKQQ